MPQAYASQLRHRVSHCRRHEGHRHLANVRRMILAVNKGLVYVGNRCHAYNRVIMEVGLLHNTRLNNDRFIEHAAQAMYKRAL
jgi:hypothetical protein